ncbi:MAG: type VI secretion system-associated protein TagF [Litoreibacter sp.]
MARVTGFFGKIPTSGDFVARGLPVGIKPVLDRWLTKHLIQFSREPKRWPSDGVRSIWDANGRGSFPLLILPSHDAAGRHFPLVFCADSENTDQHSIDIWANAIIDCTDLSQTADQIAMAVQKVARPAPSTLPLIAPSFWTGNQRSTNVEQLFNH